MTSNKTLGGNKWRHHWISQVLGTPFPVLSRLPLQADGHGGSWRHCVPWSSGSDNITRSQGDKMQGRRRCGASLRPLRPLWSRGPQQLFTVSEADCPPLPLPRGPGWCGKEMPRGKRSTIRETSWWTVFHKFPVISSSLRKWDSLIITCWKLSVRSSSTTRWLYRGLKAESDTLPKIINAEHSITPP